MTLERLLEVFKNDPGVIWVIIALAAAALFITVERLFHFHRCQIDTRDFLEGIFNNLKRNNLVETVSICDDTPGPVAHLVRAAVLRAGASEKDIVQAVDEVTQVEIARLERNIPALATIAQVAPLLGLLGTVVGMIQAFEHIRGAATINLSSLAPFMESALICTASGLVVAIPSYLFYNFLVTRVQAIINEMNMAASEIVYFLTHNPIKVEGSQAPGV